MPNVSQMDGDIVERAGQAGQKIEKIRSGLGSVIFGQQKVVDLTLVTLLAGGHALLIGVPGLAKTSLVEALGSVLGLDKKRIQFTPDLMPSDIVGSEVLEESAGGQRSFRFIKGPVFTQLLMADEINRASPKTQSALLQAMQEHHVTVAGQRYDVPSPFHVLATQNPLEQEGTYPLPEAQLDRFLMQIDVTYPDADGRTPHAVRHDRAGAAQPVAGVLRRRTAGHATAGAADSRGRQVVDAILRLVRAARPGTPEAAPRVNELVAWGPGPRASQALMLSVRARALLEGRLAPSVDDVIALAEPVLKHRMALSFAARAEDITISEVIAGLTQLLG